MPTRMLSTEDLLHETTEELGKEESVQDPHTLDPELLRKMNAYWRAANYLSVGQIYLYANPLLKEPLKLEHVKPLVVLKELFKQFSFLGGISSHVAPTTRQFP